MFEQFGIINPWIYIAGAFMIVIAPGPNSLYVLKTSVLDGRRAGCAGLLAVLIGDAVLIFLAYLGVAAMIKSHPLAFSMVKIGGGIYLAWIGAKVIWNTFFVKRAKPAGTAAELSVSDQGYGTACFPHSARLVTYQSQVDSFLRFLFRSIHRQLICSSGDFILYSRDDS